MVTPEYPVSGQRQFDRVWTQVGRNPEAVVEVLAGRVQVRIPGQARIVSSGRATVVIHPAATPVRAEGRVKTAV